MNSHTGPINKTPCPDDTNGDGDCGKPACPVYGKDRLAELRRTFTNDYAANLVRDGLSLDSTVKVPFMHHFAWKCFLAGHKHASKNK